MPEFRSHSNELSRFRINSIVTSYLGSTTRKICARLSVLSKFVSEKAFVYFRSRVKIGLLGLLFPYRVLISHTLLPGGVTKITPGTSVRKLRKEPKGAESK